MKVGRYMTKSQVKNRIKYHRHYSAVWHCMNQERRSVYRQLQVKHFFTLSLRLLHKLRRDLRLNWDLTRPAHCRRGSLCGLRLPEAVTAPGERRARCGWPQTSGRSPSRRAAPSFLQACSPFHGAWRGTCHFLSSFPGVNFLHTQYIFKQAFTHLQREM